MAADFQIDPNPGKPKILFVGLGGSTHTYAWINLLSDSDFNVRLFALPEGGIPLSTWKVKTYLPQQSHLIPVGLDLAVRHTLFPPPEVVEERVRTFNLSRKKKPLLRFHSFAVDVLNRFGENMSAPRLMPDMSFASMSASQIIAPHEWLARIINDWKPDIVHTLGLEPSGFFYYQTLRLYPLDQKPTWLLQLRGGSDLAFTRFVPETVERMQEVFRESDQILSDNRQNVEYLRQMGVTEKKISPLTPTPGAGGIDLQSFASLRQKGVSQSREIVFPKGYELVWSKSLPVFEALQICWEHISPCRIHILNVSEEVRLQFLALPQHIRDSCVIHDRLPQKDFFSLISGARVLLIPSLVDGVPNSLYEAMALGVFPIVSPLETIRSVVKNEENVLFARNLYPEELASALSRAMTDDALVENAARNNLELVSRLADRQLISSRVIKYYEQLADRN